MAKRGKNKEAVAIARDVIAQIKARRYDVTQGLYVAFAEGDKVIKQGDLQKQLRRVVTKNKPCSVCALGSAFISAVRLYDKFEVEEEGEDLGDGATQYDKLQEFFAREELGRIEAIFERNPTHLKGADRYDYGTGYGGYLSDYFPNFSQLTRDLDPEEALTLLMREVIRQNGGFDKKKAEDQAAKILSRAESIRSEAFELAIEEAYDAR